MHIRVNLSGTHRLPIGGDGECAPQFFHMAAHFPTEVEANSFLNAFPKYCLPRIHMMHIADNLTTWVVTVSVEFLPKANNYANEAGMKRMARTLKLLDDINADVRWDAPYRNSYGSRSRFLEDVQDLMEVPEPDPARIHVMVVREVGAESPDMVIAMPKWDMWAKEQMELILKHYPDAIFGSTTKLDGTFEAGGSDCRSMLFDLCTVG